MDEVYGSGNTSVTIVEDCLIVTIPDYIEDTQIESRIESLMLEVHNSGVIGVIMDLSSVTAVDSHGYAIIQSTSKAILLLGTKVVWTGIRPGVVAALMELKVEVSGINTAIDLEHGIDMIVRGKL